MEFAEGGRRKKELKDVLYFLSRLYGAVTTRGIKAIHFLNDTKTLGANDIATRDQIERVINSHEFKGLARIGTGLHRRILAPLVLIKKSGVQRMERPLLVVVITSGVVSFLPSLSLG